jgi:hypothetical protein
VGCTRYWLDCSGAPRVVGQRGSNASTLFTHRYTFRPLTLHPLGGYTATINLI